MISVLKKKFEEGVASTEIFRKIPGPKGKLFIGDAMAFDEDPIAWMQKTQGEYGDVVRLDSETIVIHAPDLISEVLANTNEDFLLDNAFVAGKKGRQLLVDGLVQWMQSRKYLEKSISRKILEHHINRAGNCLSREADKLAGKTTELFDASQGLLGVAIADFCLGADESFREVFDAVEKVFWASLAVTDSNESRLPWAPRPIAKRAQRLNIELVSLLAEVIQRRRVQGEPIGGESDALDQLLKNLAQAPKEQLIAAVRLMMVTAHGPSGSVFSWCLLRLAERPDLVEQIRHEMAQKNEGMLIPSKYPVTHSVLREVMRMHPPNWLMGRTAQRDTELAGFRIKENCRVLFSPYTVHRDARFWKHPDVFDPARWQSGKSPYTDNAYFPFGGGPRVCPGALLGPIQLMLGLNAILNRYDLILPPVSSVESVHSTLLRPKNVNIEWIVR